MEHEAKLVVTVVGGLVLAFGFGFIANQLRLPLIVGYLVAGIVLGPFTPGIVADAHIAGELAKIGIILLMFGVGLHFSLEELLAVRWVAIPGAIGQIVAASAIATFVAVAGWGWSFGGGLVMGLALSVASTVVVLRALEERGTLESGNGRIAIGWLIVEDLAMVLTLVLLPPIAIMLGATPIDASHGASAAAEAAPAAQNIFLVLALTIGNILAFAAVVVVVGPRALPWILNQAALSGSPELFRLSIIAIALGIAYGSAKGFGVSIELGAFCAGVVLSNTPLSQRAATDTLPLQQVFAVLFFVSIGMLFDPSIVVREPLALLAVLFIILIGKSVAAFAIVLLMRYPISTALTVSASLAQIGEFSFILAGLGITLGLMPPEGRDLILAGSLVSVMLNPLAFAAVKPLARWFETHPRLADRIAPLKDVRLKALEERIEARKRAVAPLSLSPIELAEKFPLFADLSEAKRAEVATLFKARTVVPGTRIIRAGDAANEMFFLSKGSVDVSINNRHIVLKPGDIFGEMALMSGAPRTADVTALDYCTLLVLSREDFMHFVERTPELKEKIRGIATLREEENKRGAIAEAAKIEGA